LLLFAAMIVRPHMCQYSHNSLHSTDPQNTLVAISYTHGIGVVSEAYNQTSYSVVEGAPLPTERQAEIDRYLNRLYLQPSWVSLWHLPAS
jgi:hypothetical protein